MATRGAPERMSLRAALHTLAVMGWKAWRTNVGAVRIKDASGERFARFGVEGLPDITGYTPWGAHVAIEVKRPGNGSVSRLTDAQARHLDDVRQAGGVAAVVQTVDDVIETVDIAKLLHEYDPTAPARGESKRKQLHVLRERRAARESMLAPRPGDAAKLALKRAGARAKRRAWRFGQRTK